MSWEAISAIGEMVAAVAVILSLFYVGRQLSQNNLNQNLAALQTHYEAFRQNIGMCAEHAGTWVEGLHGFPNLETADNARFGFLIHASFRHIELAYLLNKKGVLSDEDLDGSMRLICGLYAYPGCQNWWETRKGFFDAEFVEKEQWYFNHAGPTTLWGEDVLMKPVDEKP